MTIKIFSEDKNEREVLTGIPQVTIPTMSFVDDEKQLTDQLKIKNKIILFMVQYDRDSNLNFHGTEKTLYWFRYLKVQIHIKALKRDNLFSFILMEVSCIPLYGGD